MPRLWDRSKRKRRTPFSDVLADYLEAHKWMRPKHLASDTGLSATTIQRYLNGDVVPTDPHILQQISAGTSIPLAQLYQAAHIPIPTAQPAAPPSPPRARDHETRHRPPRIAEQQSPYAALHEFIRSVQAWHLDDETRQALISEFVSAVQAAPTVPIAPEPPPAWDDHDAVSTLQVPTVTAPPVQQAQQHESESQLACERT